MSAGSAIERIKLFAGLSPSARDRLAAAASLRSYTDGQIILLEGDQGSPVFFVLQGAVRAFRTNLDGREQTLIHLGPGAAFNMPAAFAAGAGVPSSAVAVGPVELLSISRSDFSRIVAETPEIAQAVLRDFSHKLIHLTNLTHDLGLRSVRARLARFLLGHGVAEGGPPVRWTHQEIAAQIGTVREVVSRTMRSFVREGLIRVERHRILVVDRVALDAEAES